MLFFASGLSVSGATLDLDLNCFGQYYTDHSTKTMVGYNGGGGVEESFRLGNLSSLNTGSNQTLCFD